MVRQAMRKRNSIWHFGTALVEQDIVTNEHLASH